MDKTFFIETYGCEMNIAESASVEQLFLSRGWTKSDSAQTADVAIINTCSVRGSAEERILGRLGWFNGLKAVREGKPNAKRKMHEEAVEFVKQNGKTPLTLVVMGCMAERLLHEFKEKYPFIDYVVGTFAKHHFGEIIDALEDGRKPFELDDSEKYKFAPISAEPGAFSTFVPIMHGCNNFCTYCIVPYVRGRECSRSVDEILKEIDVLSSYKVREITLIGQNVNSYYGQIYSDIKNHKSGENINFANLLEIIAERLRETNSSIEWVRFMSSHPKDLTDDVINVIAKEDVICRHIHLAVQHGSNSVLKRMNRNYTREHYLELIKKIKERIPDVSLTTDIMVGFPGETEEDLELTLDLMNQVKFESAMMYYYNPREGTPAAKMEQLPEELRKQRLQKVINLQLEHTHEEMSKRVGQTKKVLVESVSRDNKEELLGQTEQHEKVAFLAPKNLIGKFVKVHIDELSGNTFRGHLEN